MRGELNNPGSGRGNNGNVRRSFGFGPVRIQGGIRLNDADWTHWSEPARTLLRIDKLGVTGSSPVPPIHSLGVTPIPHGYAGQV